MRSPFFATTRWSLVLAAGDRSGHEAEAARAALLETYWFPVYVSIRRRGHDGEAALDLTQGFFLHFLEKALAGKADADRGRFRSFLRGCVDKYLLSERDREGAARRGGGRVPVSIDAEGAENRFALLDARAEDPARAFERAFAHSLLHRVIDRLAEEYMRKGRGDLCRELLAALFSDEDASSQAAIARRTGMTEGAVKVAAFRLRDRLRRLLREEVEQTLAEPGKDLVEDEIRSLFSSVRGQTV